MGAPENKIERYLQDQCAKRDWLCYKFASPSNAGVPDRIVIGAGQVIFVELKRPGGKPRKLQKLVHARMRARGATVCVCDTQDSVDELLDHIASSQKGA